MFDSPNFWLCLILMILTIRVFIIDWKLTKLYEVIKMIFLFGEEESKDE